MKEERMKRVRSGVSSDEKSSGRRDFLKKAAYTAPKLIVLGYMAKASTAGASTFDETTGPGGGFGGGNPPFGG